MKTCSAPLLVALILALTPQLGAEDAPATPAPSGAPPPPPEARQFDFWVGEWEVTGPKGQVVGHSRIELILNDRAIQEHWTGAGGSSGTSLNVYDAETQQWRQFWVDHTGNVLQLIGGWYDGQMVLRGNTRTNDQAVLNCITWTPNADGSVRQLWEQSTDGAKTWDVLFEGLYRKHKP